MRGIRVRRQCEAFREENRQQVCQTRGTSAPQKRPQGEIQGAYKSQKIEDKAGQQEKNSRLKSSDRPCAFGADLLNDRVGREIGQEQRGDEQGAEDGFDAV
jgi:hypothetical protein